MADDDPAAARRALEAEAERLKAKRLDAQQRDAAEVAEAKASVERHLHSVSAASLRKALSRPAYFWLGASALFAALVALFIPTSATDADAPTPGEVRAFAIVAGCLGAFLVLHHYSAVLRARAWLKRLPFQVEGFDDTLGYNMFYRRVELTLEFADTRPTDDVIRELVTARLGEDSSVSNGVLIRENLSSDSANFPAANWFRKAVKRVVLDVHRAYPVARVHFRGLAPTEFYHGSGD